MVGGGEMTDRHLPRAWPPRDVDGRSRLGVAVAANRRLAVFSVGSIGSAIDPPCALARLASAACLDSRPLLTGVKRAA